MKGTFYAVGVGPGDPELLTVKAIKTIGKCDVIAAPNSGATKNIALTITAEYIKDKEIKEIDMPMTKDKKMLSAYHDKASDDIAKILDSGKNVAFLTLGDPTVYSTVMYVHKRLKQMEYNTEVVSGVTSFCAAAAVLGESLCERKEMLHIIPATFNDVDKIMDLPGTKVLMKSGKGIKDIKKKLKTQKAMAVECATMENQRIYRSTSEFNEDMSYFSVIIIPE